VRSDSSSAYLRPALSRSNLDVLVSTTVTRLLHSRQERGAPKFDAVEMATSSSGNHTYPPFVRSYHS
jgi:choline dehydrogenase-like flavoprotein